MQTESKYSDLLELAAQAREKAYAPYSGFRVGAALLSKSGKVYMGCNIENIAYSPTICAERVALGSAIASGEKPGDFLAIAVVTDNPGPSTPCGVCRQVLDELAPGAQVVMGGAPEHGRSVVVRSVEDLLPEAFRFEEGRDPRHGK
jgi:cytidine deaminase